MRIRLGFVSNSSSSSFTCQVCNKTVECMDDNRPSDVGLIECENGHVFCEKHPKAFAKKLKKQYNKKENIDKSIEGWKYYTISSDICPICQFNTVSEGDVSSYILALNKENRKSIKKEMLSIFKSRKEFLKFIRFSQENPPS